jgi:hypothetical protein
MAATVGFIDLLSNSARAGWPSRPSDEAVMSGTICAKLVDGVQELLI